MIWGSDASWVKCFFAPMRSKIFLPGVEPLAYEVQEFVSKIHGLGSAQTTENFNY